MVIYNKGLALENSTDEGKTIFTLTSKEEEKYKVRRILITDVWNYSLYMEVWVEREKICDALPLTAKTGIMPERVIDIDVEIPVGRTFSVIIKPQTSGNQGAVSGWVEYEIIE